MNRIVLIADIVSSRKIKERDKMQKNLKTLLRKLNKESGEIISPLTITLGDEFQCVYSSGNEIFRHVWQILDTAYPEKIRFSFGIGEISTAINKEQAIGMDGPAFYAAREGLSELKQKNYLFNISKNTTDTEILSFIKSTVFLISFHTYGWKRNRIKIMSLLEEEMTVKKIAKKLNITEQAVYKNISNGGLQLISELTSELTLLINKMVKS